MICSSLNCQTFLLIFALLPLTFQVRFPRKSGVYSTYLTVFGQYELQCARTGDELPYMRVDVDQRRYPTLTVSAHGGQVLQAASYCFVGCLFKRCWIQLYHRWQPLLDVHPLYQRPRYLQCLSFFLCQSLRLYRRNRR